MHNFVSRLGHGGKGLCSVRIKMSNFWQPAIQYRPCSLLPNPHLLPVESIQNEEKGWPKYLLQVTYEFPVWWR